MSDASRRQISSASFYELGFAAQMLVWAMRKRLHRLAGGADDSHVARVFELADLDALYEGLAAIAEALACTAEHKIQLHAVSCPCLAPHEVACSTLSRICSAGSATALSTRWRRSLAVLPRASCGPQCMRSWTTSMRERCGSSEPSPPQPCACRAAGRATWCTDPPLVFLFRRRPPTAPVTRFRASRRRFGASAPAARARFAPHLRARRVANTPPRAREPDRRLPARPLRGIR